MKVYTRETQFIRRYLVTKEQLRAVQCFVIYSFCEFKVKMRIIVICNNVTYKTKLHITHKLTLSLRSGTGDFLVSYKYKSKTLTVIIDSQQYASSSSSRISLYSIYTQIDSSCARPCRVDMRLLAIQCYYQTQTAVLLTKITKISLKQTSHM